MKKVGCSRGLVRECLAELRGEEQMVLIETISREILIKNSLTEFLCQSPFYSRDTVRYVFTIYHLLLILIGHYQKSFLFINHEDIL